MMDDFKPTKPAPAPKASREPAMPELAPYKPKLPVKEVDLDEEIGDAFAPPDEIAAAEATDDDTLVIDETESDDTDVDTDKPGKKSKKDKKADKLKEKDGDKPKLIWWPIKAWVKKQWIIAGIVAVVLILLIVGGTVVALRKPAPKAAPVANKVEEKTEPPKPTTVASKLTGLQITPEQAQLPATGVMIENSVEARPQSGLDKAGVIYEAVAEGGITRFLAIYQDEQPDFVGPIRSSRPYYLRWVLPFNAGYAHVGGSPQALADIKTLGVRDLDQYYNEKTYDRVNGREAPHDVYTSLSRLITLEKAKGYGTSVYTGFPRKEEAAASKPEATTIDFTISGPAFSAHYDYEQSTNSYKRSQAGAPHLVKDKSGGQTPLKPKVVIAMVVPKSDGVLTTKGAAYTEYQTTGSGQLYVFQDGMVQTGSWSKDGDKAQVVFSDSSGKPLSLNAGQTWISVVGLNGDVNYK